MPPQKEYMFYCINELTLIQIQSLIQAKTIIKEGTLKTRNGKLEEKVPLRRTDTLKKNRWRKSVLESQNNNTSTDEVSVLCISYTLVTSRG